MTVTRHPGAEVDDRAEVGAGTTVWPGAQVREHAVIGRDCTLGRGVYVGVGVRMGDRCKIQNAAQLFEPAVLGDGVFIGPGAILTNDRLPRAVRPDGTKKGGEDWEAVGVRVEEGASVGASATCVAPVVIGRWAMVAAGSVVARDVPPFALVAGVPAAFVRWVGRGGAPLTAVGDGTWRCPDTGRPYREGPSGVEEVEPWTG